MSNNQDPLALVLGLHFDTCVHVKGSAIIKECEKLEWPLVSWTSIISASTWPKFKSKFSFEILRTSRFQNCPYFLNFVKIWWRYCQKQNWEIFRTTLYFWNHGEFQHAVHSWLNLEVSKFQFNQYKIYFRIIQNWNGCLCLPRTTLLQMLEYFFHKGYWLTYWQNRL